jgi:hypothetical protein
VRLLARASKGAHARLEQTVADRAIDALGDQIDRARRRHRRDRQTRRHRLEQDVAERLRA